MEIGLLQWENTEMEKEKISVPSLKKEYFIKNQEVKLKLNS